MRLKSELYKKEQEEIAVLENFLPKQLSLEEVEHELRSLIESTGKSSKSDMGPLMGIANKKLAGVSDGKTIASILKNLLQ